MRLPAALSLCLVAACGAQPPPAAALREAKVEATATGTSQPAQPPATPTTRADADVARIAGGLEHPWGLAFLPDGRMLVTERPGRLRIVTRDGTLSAPLAGVPAVWAHGQGGLLDIALDPDFAANHFIYLSFAEPG